MGSNKRYPGHDIERAIDAVVVEPRPISLTESELDLENEEVSTPPKPIPADAWVRFHEATIRTPVKVIEYTSRAARAEWVDWYGRTLRAWVWGSAVKRRR